jgi:hypothetical protein
MLYWASSKAQVRTRSAPLVAPYTVELPKRELRLTIFP